MNELVFLYVFVFIFGEERVLFGVQLTQDFNIIGVICWRYCRWRPCQVYSGTQGHGVCCVFFPPSYFFFCLLSLSYFISFFHGFSEGILKLLSCIDLVLIIIFKNPSLLILNYNPKKRTKPPPFFI